jgi:hypothetical protein
MPHRPARLDRVTRDEQDLFAYLDGRDERRDRPTAIGVFVAIVVAAVAGIGFIVWKSNHDQAERHDREVQEYLVALDD